MKIIGIVLIAFGLFALIAGGISYTDRDTVVDIGPLEAQTEETRTFPLSPIAGIAAIGAGIALVVIGSKSRSRV